MSKKNHEKGYDLTFQPKERRRRDQMLKLLGGFCAILLLLVIVSTVALQKDGLVDQIISALNPAETTTEPPANTWQYSGSARLLLCGTDAGQQNLRFCAIVQVDAAARKVYIFPLSPKALAPHDAGERSLEQALRDGGPKELETAAEALTQSTIDRYLCSKDEDFISAINIMGSVTVQVEERIRYRGSDFTLTLAEGTQRLQGDMLLRYFRWLGKQENGALAQGELLRRVLETYLTVPMETAKMETRFNQLMNLLQTDLSATDFYTRQNLLQAMLVQGNHFTVAVKE